VTRRLGFWLGLAAFAAMLALPPPAGLASDGWRTAAVAVLMAVWWFTEAVPVALTGSLPFLALPLLGVARPEAVAAQYMSPVLFLVLGGAMLGIALEKWQLHRRLAIAVVARSSPEPRRLLLSFMLATAFVSMWVNNSATTVMMLPIATALIAALTRTLDGPRPDPDEKRFAAALVLSVAYASNLGGFATPIGTPVNPVAIGIIEREFGIRISFLEWMSFGIPLALTGVLIAWLLLSRLSLPFCLAPARREDIMAAIGPVGPLNAPQWRVIAVVAGASLAWVSLPWLATLLPGLSDAGVAVAAALALCVIPAGANGSGGRLLEWSDARQAPWYLILLLGGGLALADSVVRSGLGGWLAGELSMFAGLPLPALLLLLVLMCVAVTECASNIATASILMPIAATLAGGGDALLLSLAAGIAASWGFANPAGTSSNAMVFGTGRIGVGQMLRAGLWLDLAGALLIVATLVAWSWLR
jgi:sodium-dependent dicarboxylate transporter 2/3/5